jgi:hypothetical protein
VHLGARQGQVIVGLAQHQRRVAHVDPRVLDALDLLL